MCSKFNMSPCITSYWWITSHWCGQFFLLIVYCDDEDVDCNWRWFYLSATAAQYVYVLFIVQHTFKQWLISCSKQIGDHGNIVGTISIMLATSQEGVESCTVFSRAQARPRPRSSTVYELAMTTARNTSWSELTGGPWSRRTRSAYNELEHVVNSELTWSAAVNLSLSTTPSAVILCRPTWQMSRQTGGCFTDLPRVPRPVNTVSKLHLTLWQTHI